MHVCKCPGEDHPTYGACLRGKGIRIAFCNSVGGWDASTQKRWDSRLDEFRSAAAQGIVPKSTSLKDIRDAVEKSDKAGAAFNAELVR